ncbi:MAG: hypothetical protein KDA27_24080, partial [Candidatus Eisenbacteria bacterium]|nr:hypothetical protein [Candidatus Eisenbacteria bacterium]
WGSSDTDVWCLGRNEGDLFHWDGSEWALVEAGFLPFGWEIWGNSASDVYFGGLGLLRWNGQEFETVMAPYGGRTAFAMSVHGSGAGDIVTCGFDGRVAWFDGSAWDQTIVGLPTGAVFRIGEYHGIDVAGVRAAVTWTGNTNDPVPVPQSMFERILVDSTTAGIGEIDDAVSLLLLEENTPNPFRWVTQLSYSLSAEAEVSLSIFDVAGKRVRDVERGLRTAGAYSVSWDGRDGGGNVVSPGVYFAVLEDSGGGKCVRKMTLVR